MPKELTPEQTRTFYMYLLIMIITGATNTIFVKLQNTQHPEILGAPFAHPWFQSLQMFIGESYCAILWFIFKDKIKKQEEEEIIKEGKELDDRPEPSIFIFLFTCSCDVLGTTLLNFALLMMASSIFQMLRGGVIIITCLFTVIFFCRYCN